MDFESNCRALVAETPQWFALMAAVKDVMRAELLKLGTQSLSGLSPDQQRFVLLSVEDQLSTTELYSSFLAAVGRSLDTVRGRGGADLGGQWIPSARLLVCRGCIQVVVHQLRSGKASVGAHKVSNCYEPLRPPLCAPKEGCRQRGGADVKSGYFFETFENNVADE